MNTHTDAFEAVKKKIISVLEKNPRGLRTREIAEKVCNGKISLNLRAILNDLVLERRIKSRYINISVRIGYPLVVDNYYI